ncbi:MAG TPA: SGNH/GDSL hydrolase family protein [Vitreimonas sp.]|nr:SGNH/GDSL hydrolase family protein [Vitreimonas sp.]
MMRDVSIPDSAFIPYLTAYRTRSAPMRPAIIPNSRTVTMSEAEERRVRGAMAMNWANGVARWRREQRFNARLQSNDPILVSEGDSWFQFPFFLDDVIDQLGSSYNVLSTCAAGDTVKRMLGPAPDYLRSLRRLRADGKKVCALLFSGAGNDFIDVLAGKGAELPIVNLFSAGKPASWYLRNAAFDAKVAFIDAALRSFLQTVRQEFPGLPVVLHGYDYPIPAMKQGDWRNPQWTKIDAWLAGPMTKRRIVDHKLQSEIVRELIDRHNAMLKQIASAFSNTHYIDLRGVVTPHTMWADEIHPTNNGFALVAGKFLATLKQIGCGGAP